MGQMDLVIDQLPPGALAYQHAIADAPGVATSNNFLSLFNPVGSIKTIATVAFIGNAYGVGSSSTPNSMLLLPTSAASGGTQVAAASITKADSNQSNSVADVRVGNPTVTTTSSIPHGFVAPFIGSGVGGVGNASQFAPQGVLPLLHPGQGVVFNTSAGNTNQRWDLLLVWIEF